MLSIPYIDIKTRKGLTELAVDGAIRVKQKEIKNSYLEHWLDKHEVRDSQFWVGKFYDRRDVDTTQMLERLERDGKILVFTNGETGYFADSSTAKLLTEGNREQGIEPIFADDRHSPHNFVAYGSLVASDGITSTAVGSPEQKSRILVIDDKQRMHGSQPLVDDQGRVVLPSEIEKLYDKMGDGTMLISKTMMQQLILPQERETIAQKVVQSAGITLDQLPERPDILDRAERQIDQFVHQTATQFRAASTDLPGEIKGTMATSQWCERLGVDAIISVSDIKGADERLLEPGMKEVSDWWVNRKSDGKWGDQKVGPQVKGTIPEATLHEFNPKLKESAEALSKVASDPIKLLQHYVAQKDRRRELIQSESEESEEGSDTSSEGWLYEVGKADAFGLLYGLGKVNYELERTIQKERVDIAVAGIYVPSAMAQHHAQLQPWEVSNADLPHGSIVAYYRSPFANVGAAAIGINNTQIIREQDPEASQKVGVSYLNPWTAQNIAITDFDKDANGYFVGAIPQSRINDLPQQIRATLVQTAHLSPAEQYEAGRSLLAGMMQEMQTKPEQSPLKPGEYPMAVSELIEHNAPENKPPEIGKQPKAKHEWQVGESRSAATWRAWQTTANNPTGQVANAGMALRSFAWETQYAPDDRKEALLKDISKHYAKQLKKVDRGNLQVPTDQQLQDNSFPAYHLLPRMQAIANANVEIQNIKAPEQRRQFVDEKLAATYRLLMDTVDGPNAMNLQTAVDTAKSSRGIDEQVQAFAEALKYKSHELQQNQKSPKVYVQGKVMPTNTQEPIGWGVEQANQFYQETQLPELENRRFQGLMPKTATLKQEMHGLAIAREYNHQIKTAVSARDRLRENRPEDGQPTLMITSPVSGHQLTIQGLSEADPDSTSPIWETEGGQPDWKILIEKSAKPTSQKTAEILAKLSYVDEQGTRQVRELGVVSSESVAMHQLEEKTRRGHLLTIASPITELRPPFAQQHNIEQDLKAASAYLKEAIAQIPTEERAAYASALWHHAEGVGVVLREFTPELIAHLQQAPEMVIRGVQYPTNEVGILPEGEYQIRFRELSYINQKQGQREGMQKTVPAIAIVSEAGEKMFGALSDETGHLPPGSLARAHIQVAENGRTAKVRVLEKLELGEPSASPLPETIEVSEPAERYAISSGETRSWYAAVKDRGDRLLEEKITELGKSLKQHYNDEEWGDGTLLPPDEYKTTEVTVSNTEQVQLQQALKNLRSINAESQSNAKSQPLSTKEDSAIPDGSQYSISSGEARAWYAAVKDRGDRLLEERITTLGKSLKQYYNDEEWGDGTLLPPDEYKAREVTITQSEQEQMHRTTLAATAKPIAPLHSSMPVPPEQKRQIDRD
jgi:hypothetical protein